MTHRHNNEREFEAFLAGEESELARLYRRLPQSEPDAKLDAAVLGLARAAVEPQRVNALRHANQRHRRPWWLVGLSSAAGLVLAAGVAWQLRQGMPQSPVDALRPSASSSQPDRDVVPIAVLPEAPVPPPPPPAPFEDVAATAAAPAPVVAAEAPAAGAPRARATPPPLQREAAASKGEAQKKDIKPAEPPSPAAPALAAQPQSQEAAKLGDGRNEEASRFTATSKESDSARQQASDAFADRGPRDHNSVERKAALATGSRRDEYGLTSADDGRVASREGVPPAKRASAEAPAAAGGAATMAAAPVAEVAATPATTTATAPAVQDKQKAEAEALASAATRSPAPAAAKPGLAYGNEETRATASDEELRRNAELTPELWIAEIRQLLKQQRRQAALDNLARFKQKHPQFALPADLRELR